MAKYSTGSDRGGGDGDACELCGRETSNLEQANVAGADLLVCSDCTPHGDTTSRDESGSRSGSSGSRDGDEPNRRKRAAQNAARIHDAAQSNTKRWEEEGTDYESDQLPYLVSDYGDRVESARQDEGLTVEELAADIDADEDDILALEQGRAARAGVGGSVVRTVEKRLDIRLVDE